MYALEGPYVSTGKRLYVLLINIACVISVYRQTSNISHTLVSTCWLLRCSCSIAFRRCSNYSFILDLTPGFNGLGKGNCATRRESFKLWDMARLTLEILRYTIRSCSPVTLLHSEWMTLLLWYYCVMLMPRRNKHIADVLGANKRQ